MLICGRAAFVSKAPSRSLPENRMKVMTLYRVITFLVSIQINFIGEDCPKESRGRSESPLEPS